MTEYNRPAQGYDPISPGDPPQPPGGPPQPPREPPQPPREPPAPDPTQPYAHPPPQEVDLATQGYARVNKKLDEIRSGRGAGKRVGPYWPLLAVACVSWFPGSLLTWGAVTLAGHGNKEDGIFAAVVGAIALLFFSIPLLAYRLMRLHTPKRALHSFYRALATGAFDRARAIAVANDLDDTPRIQPQIMNLGRPSMYSFVFRDPRQFKVYWTELIRSHVMPYCNLRIKNLKIHQAAPDLVTADFTLKLTMNTQLWGIGIIFALLPGILIAAIGMSITNKRVEIPMRKVLVKVDDQWRIFNAEWQGFEETDLAWIW